MVWPNFTSTIYKQQKGAALLAVLVVALVLVILMGVASSLLQSRIQLAQDSKDSWQQHAQMFAKRSELIYLLATQRHTVAGVSPGKFVPEIEQQEFGLSFLPIGDEIRTDGHEYQEEPGLKYSIQNTAGLIAINSPDQTWLKRWFKSKGFTLSEQNKMADTLADYADPDNVRRASGAEASQYQNSPHIQQARNFLLQSCNELWRVHSWPYVLNRYSNFINSCSTRRGETLNLNAVPKLLWKVLWPNSFDKVFSNRLKNQWFTAAATIIEVEPSIATVNDDYYSLLGGQRFILRLKMNRESHQYKIRLSEGLNQPYELIN
ncbi:hypothetical protein [Paraglaciecola aestuariivivens]